MNLDNNQVAQLYRNQGREVPEEFRVPDMIRQCVPRGVPAPREKYGRKKVTLDGRQFDSTGEAQAWTILQLWERAGIITELEVQPEFLLEPKLVVAGKTIRAIKYRADFLFKRHGRTVVVDYKGPELNKSGKATGVRTPAFKIKAKLFKARFPHLDLEIWDRNTIKELGIA